MRKPITIVLIVAFIFSAIIGVAAAKDKTEKGDFNTIEIYRGAPPKRPYKELGPVAIEVPKTMGRAQAITLLKKKAYKKYDADAVINVEVQDVKTGGAPRTVVCPDGRPGCHVEEPVPFYDTKASGMAVRWK